MVRNIFAVIAGIVVGSVVNGFLINIDDWIIPLPPGTDNTTLEGINAAIPLMGPEHFILPFIAHAAGALVGALVASLIAASHQFKISIGIGIFFLLGGIAAVWMINAPLWFEAVDLIFAYIPMAWIGWKLAGGKK